jgi:hypothetical protein
MREVGWSSFSEPPTQPAPEAEIEFPGPATREYVTASRFDGLSAAARVQVLETWLLGLGSNQGPAD